MKNLRFGVTLAENTKAKRNSINLELSPGARAIVEVVREETGVPKVEAVERVLEWFASLPLELRLAVLNKNDDARRRLLKTVVDEMAGDAAPGAEGNVPADERQAIRLIQRLAARLELIRQGRAGGDVQPKGRGSKR